jgi:hypothetical protein
MAATLSGGQNVRKRGMRRSFNMYATQQATGLTNLAIGWGAKTATGAPAGTAAFDGANLMYDFLSQPKGTFHTDGEGTHTVQTSLPNSTMSDLVVGQHLWFFTADETADSASNIVTISGPFTISA